MPARLRLLAILNAVFLLSALGCGDEGGCGPAPDKTERQAAPAGGRFGDTGSGRRGADIEIQDKKGRVPKRYQRPASAQEPKRSTETVSEPVVAVAAPRPAPARVTKRKVDGIADRVEMECRISAASPDGECSGAANYAEIKERCCPGGFVERCRTTIGGVLIVGRGCDPATR